MAREKGADGAGEALGFVSHLRPGAADDSPAGDGEALVTDAVLLEGGDGSVDAAAVGFDDEPGIPPHKVGHHRDAVNDHMTVDLGSRKVTPSAERKESFLELPFGVLFTWVVVSDGEPKTSDAASTPASLQQLLERGKVEDSFDFSLRHRITERPR